MPRRSTTRPIVVGVGASAGGLEAFKRFFRNMPADSGLAFVLVQHLDPTHESLTAELIARCTAMPAVQVERDTAVAGDHIYVIPPNRYLRIENGILRLSTPPEPRGMRMAIDVFLRSLTADQQEKAIGIVLSGTGTDGTLGLKEIKAFGGMAMVQDPKTAEYDGMPRSAITIGGVDYVLSPEKMPEALLQYLRHPYVKGAVQPRPTEHRADELNSILALLWTRVKFDFSPYRKGTLVRRIERRMSLAHVERMADYLRQLRSDAAEVTALFKDLLIGVTSFFREPKAWQLLEQQVLPPFVAAKTPGSPLRVWVAACATGEEAYSLAMLLIEQLHAAQKTLDIQIFATDVDTDALEFARAGVYPESIAADVPPHCLRRFFTQGDHSYRVSKELREAVTFAEQNLIADPPFSRIDLISCRNLLIYLEPPIQKKIVSLLHFALADGGYLFLGSAETMGQQEDLFETVSKKWRVYRRVGPTRHDKVQFPVVPAPDVDRRRERPQIPTSPDLGRLANFAQQLLLERYAPASVVINRKYEILYFCGRTEDYLTQPPGLPTHDLVATAREGLQTTLRGAVHRALRENQPLTINARVKRHNVFQRVQATIEPLKVANEMEGLLLVSFRDEPEETAAAPAATQPPSPHAGLDDSLVPQLEYELKTTREDLQTSIEELETSNEELKSANEEVMSINEELQSTNEELETSKEELQSLNEELTTVNNQLESKVAELEAMNNDLENLLASTNVPTIFLDTQLCIRRFTPPTATRLFKLIPSDVGRPLGDIVQRFTDRELLPDAATVLEKFVPIQKEIQADDGRWYIRQVLPYRTQDNRIEGVVLTFSDVAADAIEEARRYAESIVNTVREPLLVLHSDLRVRSANRSFYEAFQTSPEETENRPLYELLNEQWDVPKLRASLAEVLTDGKVLQDFEIECALPDIGPRTLLFNARALAGPGRNRDSILLAIEDVTERVRIERALRATNEALRGDALFEGAPAGITIVDTHGRILSINAHMEKLFGYAREELIGRPVEMLVPAQFRAAHGAHRASFAANPQTRRVGRGRDLTAVRKDGTEFPVEIGLGPVRTEDGLLIAAHVSDISARKQAEEALRNAHEGLERRVLERTAELRATNERMSALSSRMLTLQDEERRRIGRDLHDSTAQNLAGVAMSLTLVQRSTKRLSAPAQEALAESIALVDQCSREIRTFSYLLHPPLLDEVGLVSAVRWYADGFAKRSGIQVDVEVPPELGRLPQEMETALFRIVQECLTNAHRHAGSATVRIEIARDTEAITLRVEDKGQGMPAEISKVGANTDGQIGVGIRSMQERVRQLGGQLHINSSDHGTAVEVTLPLAEPPRQ